MVELNLFQENMSPPADFTEPENIVILLPRKSDLGDQEINDDKGEDCEKPE